MALYAKTVKHFPSELCEKSRDASQEDSKFLYNGDITAVRWLDSRDVYALSTHISISLTKVKQQGGDSGSEEDVSCPEIIADYN